MSHIEHADLMEKRSGLMKLMLQVKSVLEKAPTVARRDLVRGKIVYLQKGRVVSVQDPEFIEPRSVVTVSGAPPLARAKMHRLSKLEAQQDLAAVRRAAEVSLRRELANAGVSLGGAPPAHRTGLATNRDRHARLKAAEAKLARIRRT